MVQGDNMSCGRDLFCGVQIECMVGVGLSPVS